MPNVSTNYAEGHVAKCPPWQKREATASAHSCLHKHRGPACRISTENQRWVIGTLGLKGPPGTGRADPVAHLWAWNCPSPVWFLSPQSWALEQGNIILSLFYQNVRASLIRDLSFYSVSHFWTCDSSGTPKVSLCFLGMLMTQGIQANEELLIGNNS